MQVWGSTVGTFLDSDADTWNSVSARGHCSRLGPPLHLLRIFLQANQTLRLGNALAMPLSELHEELSRGRRVSDGAGGPSASR